jgi:hypothetical protein
MRIAQSELRYPRLLARVGGKGGIVSSSHARVPQFVHQSENHNVQHVGE